MPLEGDSYTGTAGLTDAEAPAPIEDPQSTQFEPSSEHSSDKTLQGHSNHSSPSSLLQTLQTISWLTFFSLFGTLTRLGLASLTNYPGAPLGGVVWANFTGCIIMGFLVEDTQLFSPPPPSPTNSNEKHPAPAGASAKKTLPLYIGLTTGYCGSVTSFSSFMLDGFKHLANVAPSWEGRPTKGYNFMAYLAYTISTLCLSSGGVMVGAVLSKFLHRWKPRLKRDWLRVVDIFIIPIAALCWLAAILMSIWIRKWRADPLFACVFAPLGVYGRFWVSKWLNPVTPKFPVGTFVVNVVGTGILAGVTVGLGEKPFGMGCGLLKGVGDGFCGCLTTVSTFVTEMRGLGAKRGYIYGAVSVVAGICVMIVILGSYIWTNGGLNEARC